MVWDRLPTLDTVRSWARLPDMPAVTPQAAEPAIALADSEATAQAAASAEASTAADRSSMPMDTGQVSSTARIRPAIDVPVEFEDQGVLPPSDSEPAAAIAPQAPSANGQVWTANLYQQLLKLAGPMNDASAAVQPTQSTELPDAQLAASGAVDPQINLSIPTPAPESAVKDLPLPDEDALPQDAPTVTEAKADPSAMVEKQSGKPESAVADDDETEPAAQAKGDPSATVETQSAKPESAVADEDETEPAVQAKSESPEASSVAASAAGESSGQIDGSTAVDEERAMAELTGGQTTATVAIASSDEQLRQAELEVEKAQSALDQATAHLEKLIAQRSKSSTETGSSKDGE